MSNYRDTRVGDINDLHREIKDLNTQLRDRKHANVLLNTENARLKRQLFDLQQRLADIEVGREGKKGEASSATALRLMAAQEKQKTLATQQNFSQVMEQNQLLIDQLSDVSQQLASTQAALAAAQDGWKAAREEVAALQESTDKLEMDRNALQDQLQLVQQKLPALQQALAEEQAARSKAEELAAQMDKQRVQQQEEFSIRLAKELAGLRDSMQKAADAALAAKQAEVDVRDAAIMALQARLSQQQQMTNMAMPATLSVRERSLLPAASTAKAAAPAASAAAPGPLVPAARTPAATDTAWTNAMECILHDVTFSPSQARVSLYDLWAVLLLSAPALGIRGQRVLVAAEPQADPVPINCVYRLGMGGSPREELGLLSSSTLQLSLFNLKGAVVGGFRCPAPSGHPLAGQVVPVVACGLQHAPGVACIELFVFDKGSAEPKESLAVMSVDWQVVLPTGATPPKASEFVVDLRSTDPLMLEGARMCGIFAPGRTFTGSDTRTYQVWGLQEPRARQLATNRYLEAEVAVVDDLGLGSQPFATGTMPLAVSLTAPTKAKLEAQMLKAAVLQPAPGLQAAAALSMPAASGGSAVPQPSATQLAGTAAPKGQVMAPGAAQAQPSRGAYDASPEHGTRVVTLRTPLDIPVGTLQLTARLLDDLPVGELLSTAGSASVLGVSGGPGNGVPAPGASTGAAMAAPPLPPFHWAASMAAEQVAAGKMLTQLRGQVLGSCSRILSSLASSPGELDECQQSMIQAIDSISAHTEQLAGTVGACHSIVSRAGASTPAESELAAGMAQDVESMVYCCVSRLLLDVHQQYELAALGPVLWGMACASGPATSPAALPSPQQLKMAAWLEVGLAGLVEKLCAGTNMAKMVRPRLRATPSVLALAAATAAHASGPSTKLPTPPPPPLADVTTQAIALLTEAVDAAAVSVTQAFDACRQHLAVPPAGSSGDEYETVDVAQQQAAGMLTRVTAALTQSLTSLGPSVVAALLLEPEASNSALGSLLGPSGITGAGTGAAVVMTGSVAQQLGRAMVQLNTVLLRVLKADPASLPPADPQAAAAWLRASHKLQGQLYTASGFWMSLAVASLGKSMVMMGQRAAAVMLGMDVMGTHAVQVIQMAQAAVSKFRVNKAYDESVVDAGLPAIGKLLQLHVTAACSLAYDVATQLLLLPLLQGPHAVWGIEPWVGPPAEVAVAGVHELVPVSLHMLQQLAPTGQVDAEVGSVQPAVAEPAAPTAPTDQPPAAAPAPVAAGRAKQLPSIAGVLQQWQPHRLLLLISPAPGTATSASSAHKAQEQGQALSLAASLLGFTVMTLEQVVAGPQYEGMGDRDKVVAAGGAADAAVLLMPEQEAGSAPKWLASGGLLMLQPEQDTELQQAMDRVEDAAVNPAHESVAALACLLASRLGQHIMGRVSAAVQAMETAGTGNPPSGLSGAGSSSAANVSGSGVPYSARLITYLGEGVGLVKPLVTASRALQKKLADAIEQLNSSFSTAAPNLQACAGSVAKAAQAAVTAQQVLFEGLLLAAEPPPTPPPAVPVPAAWPEAVTLSVTAPAATSAPSPADGPAVTADAAVTAATKPALPTFLRQSPPATQGGAPPAAGAVPATAAVLATATAPGAGAAAAGDDGASTASEDAEPFVIARPARPADMQSELESEISGV